jgi:hypothetical protein
MNIINEKIVHSASPKKLSKLYLDEQSIIFRRME